jgi:hypothetical protein
MATGYTHKVQEGKVTEFRDFAWECARAFGALITMRDDPMDAPIPEAFKVDTSFYDQMVERGKRRLASLYEMSAADADKEAAAAHADAMRGWQERKAERDQQRVRYLAMLEKVKAWVPPSSDHYGMKDFMLEQLQSSLKFDCVGYDNPPEPMIGSAWLTEEKRRAQRDIDYGTEQRAEEIERVESRNRWLTQLRESLNAAA